MIGSLGNVSVIRMIRDTVPSRMSLGGTIDDWVAGCSYEGLDDILARCEARAAVRSSNVALVSAATLQRASFMRATMSALGRSAHKALVMTRRRVVMTLA